MTGVRMGRRPLLAMALAWVLVVAGVAAVTFVVVDRAGRGVGQASAARTVAAVPSSTPSPSARPSTPEATPTPSPAATTAAPTRTTPPRTVLPTPVRSTRPPRPDSTPTVRPAEARTVSFTTEGGTVVVSCSGTRLSLDSITPRDGWRFETETEGDALEVHFKPRASEVDEVEIAIGCRGGTPTRLSD